MGNLKNKFARAEYLANVHAFIESLLLSREKYRAVDENKDRKLTRNDLPFTLFRKMDHSVIRNVCAETQLQITQTLTTVISKRQDTERAEKTSKLLRKTLIATDVSKRVSKK